ncbi:UNVERIFIED_ORG: putative permease [Arthrobacter sp. UYEF10]
MVGVLQGFFVVWFIIMVGWFVGRQRILGDNARQVLSGLTYFVASPALLFETLSKAQLGDVFAEPLLVTAVSAVCTALTFFSIAKFVLKRALGVEGQALFAAVVVASLPTAQNVFVAASRYQTGITVAKDTVLITTVVAVPAMIGVALLLN